MTQQHQHSLPDEETLFEMVNRFDVRGPRYTSYPTAPVWTSEFPAEEYPKALRTLGRGGRPVAVYLHLPYCRQRCFYCGCNSFITKNTDRMREYADSLKREIRHTASFLPPGLRHAWLHLGGGTPTHLPEDALADVLDILEEAIPGTPDGERSVEVDPRVTTDEALQLLAERGFRRISIGVQDLNPAVQQAINREFSLQQTEAFIARSREMGFTSVNLDLIYGLPLQTRSSWRETLEQVVRLRPDRLATFGYAHLPAKIKHQRAIMDEQLPVARDKFGMLLDTSRFFREQGYTAIGLDHFALPEDKLSVARENGALWRNFMGYTDIRGLEMIGFGASAIGELESMFVQNHPRPEEYQQAVDTGFAVYRGHSLSLEDKVRKQVINDLMCNMEIRIPEAAHESANGLVDDLQTTMASLQPFVREGMLEEQGDRLLVTPLGQLFLRNLAMPFDAYLAGQPGVTFSRTV